ncbi:hypothetical protein C8J57DRAFT_1239521 [Mycena rebaudengoi]|nr:hypothetical protein C8J57DRAFT_1239521 [Mycena rebaudengoi]
MRQLTYIPLALALPVLASLPTSAPSSSSSYSPARMPSPSTLDEATANARQWCTICQTNPPMSLYQPIAVSALEICGSVTSGTDTKLMKFALYAVDDTANARQWCTICQTNPLMSLYQPIAVSVLEICGSVTSGTDMKLALYAVDETALIFLLFWRCTKDIVDSLRVIDDSLIFVAGFWTNIRRHIENAQISTNKRGNFTTHVVTSGTRAPHQRTHSQGTSHYWVHDMIRTDMSRSWPNVPQTW